MDKITEWLSNPEADYMEGVSLLIPHLKNKILGQNLSKKENKFNRDKLTYELGKLVDPIEVKEPVSPKGKAKEPVAPKEKERTPSQEGISAEEEALREVMHVINLERSKLSNELVEMNSDEFTDNQRAAKYAEIEAVVNEYNAHAEELSKMINGHVEKVELPTFGKKEPQTLEELKVARQPLMEKRSKLDKKIKTKATSKQIVEWQNERAKVHAEIEEINQKLELIKI